MGGARNQRVVDDGGAAEVDVAHRQVGQPGGAGIFLDQPLPLHHQQRQEAEAAGAFGDVELGDLGMRDGRQSEELRGDQQGHGLAHGGILSAFLVRRRRRTVTKADGFQRPPSAPRGYCALMLPCFTTRPHFAISVSIYCPNWSEVMRTAEAPSRSNAAVSSGDFTAS